MHHCLHPWTWIEAHVRVLNHTKELCESIKFLHQHHQAGGLRTHCQLGTDGEQMFILLARVLLS